MAAKHAVLGLLIERPDYGYGLDRRLRQRCVPWAYTHQAIYKALEDLTSAKHVRPREGTEIEGRKPGAPRTVYEATPGGVVYFRKWMLGSPSMEAPRYDLELKIALASPRELPKLIEMTLVEEQECLKWIKALAREGRRAESGGPLSWSEIGPRLVRDTEVRRLRARIESLQESRRTMQLFLDQTEGPPSRRRRRVR